MGVYEKKSKEEGERRKKERKKERLNQVDLRG